MTNLPPNLYTHIFAQSQAGFAVLDADSLLVLDCNPAFRKMLGAGEADLQQITLEGVLDRLNPAGSSLMMAQVEESLTQDGSYQTTISRRETDIGLSYLTVEINRITGDEHEYLVIIVREAAAAEQADSDSSVRLPHSGLLHQIAVAATSSPDPKAVFITLCNELVTGLGVSQAIIALLDEDRSKFKIMAGKNAAGGGVETGKLLPVGDHPTLARVIHEHAAVVTQDPAGGLSALAPCGASLLLAPILLHEQVVGVLQLCSQQKTTFGDHDLLTAQYVTALISQVIGFSQTNESLRRDLQQHKQAEAALKASQVSLQSQLDFAMQVVNNMGQGLSITDLEGRFEYVNPVYARILGSSPRDLVGKNLNDVVFYEDIRIITNEQERRKGGLLTTYEVRLRRADGQLVDVMITGVPLRRDGKVAGAISVVTDLSERKHSENVLRRSEEGMRALVNITSAQDLDFDQKLHALLVMGCQHFGLETGLLTQIDGDRVTVVDVYSAHEKISKGMVLDLNKTYSREVLQKREPTTIEHAGASEWASHPNYLEFKLEAYMGAQVWVNGKVYGTIHFSSRTPYSSLFNAADREFLRLIAQWIGTEMERTQHLTQLQAFADEIAKKSQALAEARDEALEGTRLKSEFLATMSHEIRTPMNAVIGMTELLMETPLNREQKEYANLVHDSANVLLALINDILDFSKIEAGKLSLENIEFEAAELIEGATDMFTSKAREKNLGLMTYISPRVPPMLCGDPVRLRQVLMNLLSNAVKFTEKGEIVVSVDVVEERENQMLVRFEVKDSGIGLSETARRRLFQPFTQADGTTTRKFGGTGLGLAISRRLVEAMSGEIGVDSMEGKGSTFWFTALFTRCSTTALEKKQSLHTPLDGLRVLVVDDNATHRNIMRHYLDSWGMDGLETPGGMEALQVLKESKADGRPIHMAIVDLEMPEMDGFELSRVIHQQPELVDTKLILVTAFDQRGYGEEALRLGFSAYLTKPVKQSVLFDVIVNTAGASGNPQVPSDTAPVVEVAPLLEEPPSPTLPKRKILLAEDNPANQRLALVQLQKLGYSVEAVTTGTQAVEAVLRNPKLFAMVLMDCQMPELDGFEATRYIRSKEQDTGLHMPIVAMTANAMQGDREECLAAGMDDYVSKPVTLESLRVVLDRWALKAAPLSTGGLRRFVQSEGDLNMDAPILDQSILASIRELQNDGEPDFLTELIDIFLVDSAAHMEKTRKALADKDVFAVRREIHGLKGTSGNLGARDLVKVCMEIETLADQQQLEPIYVWMPKLEREYARVCEALKAERREN